MYQDQINELMRLSQENAWVAQMYFGITIFFMKHFTLICILGFCYGAFWLLLVHDDLQRETGVDRLTWLVVLLTIPFFGVIFYAIQALNRSAAELPAGSRPGWKRSIK